MFKENDKVYCPIIGSDIYTLGSADLLTHPVTIVNSAGIPLCFTEEGKLDHGEFVPSLFRVNEATRLKLESLYGTSFTNLSKDIVKCLLAVPNYSAQINNLFNKTEKTCLVNSKEFKRWLSQKNSITWI